MQKDAESQTELGHLYEIGGYGLTPDFERAIYWYSQAAAQEYAEAQYSLGRIYAAAQDLKQAIYWYEKAASHGHLNAKNELLVITNSNIAVAGSKEKYIYEITPVYEDRSAADKNYIDKRPAIKETSVPHSTPLLTKRIKQLLLQDNAVICGQELELTKAAARRGDSEANLKLGDLYLLGKCFEQDPDVAQMYYDRSASFCKELYVTRAVDTI